MRLKILPVRFLFILPFTAIVLFAFSQSAPSSLFTQWQKDRAKKTYPADSASVVLLNKLSAQYLYDNADSALYFAKQAVKLADAQKYIKGQADSWNSCGQAYYVMGDYNLALDASASLMAQSNKIKYRHGIASAYQIIGLVYMAQDKIAQAVAVLNNALGMFTLLGDSVKMGKTYFDLGICYDETNKPEKAFFNLDKAMQIAKQAGDNTLVTMIVNRTGDTWFHLKKYDKALAYYQQVINSNSASIWNVILLTRG